MRREFWNGRVDHFESENEEEEGEGPVRNVASNAGSEEMDARLDEEAIEEYIQTVTSIQNLYNDYNDSSSDDDSQATFDNDDVPSSHPQPASSEHDSDDAFQPVQPRWMRGEDDSDIEIRNYRNATLIDRYYYQDTMWNWSGLQNASMIADPYYDDQVYPILPNEVAGLRENREIAVSLLMRMRFLETLLNPEIEFVGNVEFTWISKLMWRDVPRTEAAGRRRFMFEFVIRARSEMSPIFEVNMFGFIDSVSIQEKTEYDETTRLYHPDSYDWENLHEYVFVANVFTPTDFYIENDPLSINVNEVRSYGGYDMNEGTFVTERVIIPFSQIRRLYAIRVEEHWEV